MKIITISNSSINRVKKRLLDEKVNKSWRAVADKYQVNVSYIYNLVKHNQVPGNLAICEALGLFDRENKKSDYTVNRRKRLDEIAQKLGHASWCAYETYILKENDEQI